MYGYCPRKFYGICSERTQNFLGDLSCRFVQRVSDVFPRVFVNVDNLTCFGKDDGNGVVFEFMYFADFPIIIVFALMEVVFNEHDLCTDFQFHFGIERIEIFGEVPTNVGSIVNGIGFQFPKFSVVDSFCFFVVGGYEYIWFLFRRFEIGNIMSVQFIDVFGNEFVVPQIVQNVNEKFVVLSVDFFEFENQWRFGL